MVKWIHNVQHTTCTFVIRKYLSGFKHIQNLNLIKFIKLVFQICSSFPKYASPKHWNIERSPARSSRFFGQFHFVMNIAQLIWVWKQSSAHDFKQWCNIRFLINNKRILLFLIFTSKIYLPIYMCQFNTQWPHTSCFDYKSKGEKKRDLS